MKKLIVFLAGFALLQGIVFAQLSKTDKDEQGPANYYYTQHDEEPWRLPESGRELLYKSAEAGAVALILSAYLYLRKKA